MAILRHKRKYDAMGAAYLVSYPRAEHFYRTVQEVARALSITQAQARKACRHARAGREVYPLSLEYEK